MIIEKDDQKKQVLYWLTKTEGDNIQLMESLRPQFKEWHEKGYFVAAFISGKGDLYEGTLDLLIHNKKMWIRQQLEQLKGDRHAI